MIYICIYILKQTRIISRESCGFLWSAEAIRLPCSTAPGQQLRSGGAPVKVQAGPRFRRFHSACLQLSLDDECRWMCDLEDLGSGAVPGQRVSPGAPGLCLKAWQILAGGFARQCASHQKYSVDRLLPEAMQMVALYSQCMKRMTSSHRRTASIGTYDTILQAGIGTYWARKHVLLPSFCHSVQELHLEQRRIRDQLDSGGVVGAVNHCWSIVNRWTTGHGPTM